MVLGGRITFYHLLFIVLLVLRLTGLAHPSAAMICAPLIAYGLLWMYSEGFSDDT
jgi:hypothetical protein